MQALRTRPALRRSGLLYLRVDDILPNPVQPRSRFDEEALRELSESIRLYGVLHPLTVRLRGGKYELVAGERRLRAAKLAGLREVPCMVVEVNLEDDFVLPWGCIVRIGGDIILIDAKEELPRRKRQRRGFPGLS